MRKNQLQLIDPRLVDDDRHADFRLDERTRQLGREGVAAAREALRRHSQRKAA